MDRRTLDRLVPIGYVAVLLFCVLFVPVAVAPIAIFGALVLAAYYTVVRRWLAAEEARRDAAREAARDAPNDPDA